MIACRQHGDDHLGRHGSSGSALRPLATGGLKRSERIGGHIETGNAVSLGQQVLGHGQPHIAETDKGDSCTHECSLGFYYWRF